jgi:hypothetical protein
MEGLLVIDIKTAKTEELRKWFYATINADTVTDEQSKLLDEIVDELNEREGRSYTKENLNISYSYYLGQFNLTNNDLPKNEGRIEFILALLEKCNGEEFRRLTKILSEQGNLSEESDETPAAPDDDLSGRDMEAPPLKPRIKPRRKFHPALIAACVAVAIFLTNTLTAYAIGFNFFAVFARWTQDTVSFMRGSPADEKPVEANNAYSRLNNTLNMLGISVDLPKYIPAGFVFDTIEPDSPTEFSNIVAWFVHGEEEFHIRVKRLDATESVLEINDEEQSEIYKGRYLITSNMHRMVAVWHQDIYELSIHGDLTYEELIKILDSI